MFLWPSSQWLEFRASVWLASFPGPSPLRRGLVHTVSSGGGGSIWGRDYCLPKLKTIASAWFPGHPFLHAASDPVGEHEGFGAFFIKQIVHLRTESKVSLSTLNSHEEPVLWGASLVRSQSREEPVLWGASLVRSQSCEEPVLWGASLVRSQSREEPVLWGASLVRSQSCEEPVTWGASLVRSQSRVEETLSETGF